MNRHLDEEERAGCFTLIVFLCLVIISVLWLFLAVSRVSLQCEYVLFPDQTLLVFLHFGKRIQIVCAILVECNLRNISVK